MTSRYKILSAITALLLVFSSICVSAASDSGLSIKLTPPAQTGKTIIEVTTEKADEPVTLAVFGDAKTAADLTGKEDGATDVSEIFTYGAEAVSDKDKKFTFEFTMSGTSGRYTAYVGPAKDGRLTEIKINYINAQEAQEASSELNQKVKTLGTSDADAEALIAFCKEEGKSRIAKLGFYSDLYDGLSGDISENELYKLILASVKDEEIDTGDSTDSARLFNLCVIKLAMDKNLDFDFKNAVTSINCPIDSCIGSELPKLDNNGFTELEQRLNKVECENGREFEDAFEEALVLTRIHYSDGFGDTKKLVEKYTEISTTGVTNDEWGLLCNEKYESFDDLDDSISEYRGSTGGGNLGGRPGGGSGGNSNSIGAAISGVDKDADKVKPLVAGFTDIPDDAWYKAYVSTLVQRGFISGRAEGIFEPESSITRCEVAKLITLIGKLERTNTASDFSDVTNGHWAYDYVMTAADNNIVTGVGNGIFAPDENITRQDLAVMISRVIALNADEASEAAEEVESEAMTLNFADSESISDYAKAAIIELTEKGIISGYEDNTYRPTNYVTRAEASKLLCGLLDIAE